jgi:hypothetical protein
MLWKLLFTIPRWLFSLVRYVHSEDEDMSLMQKAVVDFITFMVLAIVSTFAILLFLGVL